MFSIEINSSNGNKSQSVSKHIERSRPTVKRLKMMAAAGFALVAVAGCSVSNLQSAVTEESKLVNASVTKNIEPQGVASTDAELIKTVVADAATDQAPSLLAWSNPETGSRGTITAIDKYTGTHGQKCKKFQTTVHTFMGISLYNGETCELRTGFWVLSWFLREDS